MFPPARRTSFAHCPPFPITGQAGIARPTTPLLSGKSRIDAWTTQPANRCRYASANWCRDTDQSCVPSRAGCSRFTCTDALNLTTFRKELSNEPARCKGRRYDPFWSTERTVLELKDPKTRRFDQFGCNLIGKKTARYNSTWKSWSKQPLN